MRRARVVLTLALGLIAPCASGAENVPVPADLREALEAEIRETMPESCASLELPNPIPWPGDPTGDGAPFSLSKPPFQMQYAPGLYSVVIAADGASARYVRMRARLDLLAERRYVDVERTTYQYEGEQPVRIRVENSENRMIPTEIVLPPEQVRRPQPAIRYTLTREGWLATRGRPCLPLGRNELIDVRSISRSTRDGQAVAVVQYSAGVRPESIPYDPVSMARAFGPGWQGTPHTMKTAFVLTAGGWASERRFQALVRNAGNAPRTDPDVAAPDLKKIEQALEIHVARNPRDGQACIQLPSGAQVHDSRSWWRASVPERYSAGFYDFPDAVPERATEVSRGLALARDLERIGVLSSQPGTPMILHQRDELGGAQYELRPDLYRYIGSGGPPWCLAYAELAFEIVSARPRSWESSATVDFTAIARPKRYYDWVDAARAAETLPVLRVVRDHGLAVTGTAVFMDQAWRILQLERIEPSYAPRADWRRSFASLPRGSAYRAANAAKTTPEIQAIVVRTGGTVHVSVVGTGRPLIVHLSSALPVEWRLDVSGSAKLVRVVASAATRAIVRGVPAGVPVRIYNFETIRPEDNSAVPPLAPPEEPYFGSGAYAETNAMIARGARRSNIAAVETLLGGEVTVVQTELGAKRFGIPRRWSAN